jgi:4-hydroxybenzoate polyprenyltransferase
MDGWQRSFWLVNFKIKIFITQYLKLKMNYLNLIRYKNLIFIACLQYLMRYSVIKPLLQVFKIDMQMSNLLFLFLVLGTVLIAAGGYVINDYFDTKIDALNRPEKVIVGNAVSRNQASVLHQVLTGIGILCGLIVAFAAHSFTIGLIFILVPGLLWFYSASYKRQFLIGNLIVAFNSALVVLLVVVSESAFQTANYGADLIGQTPILPTLYAWICGFALFVFLITFIREIVKDMEDEYGDRELECRTMPVVWGFKKTKYFLYALIVFVVFILGLITFKYLPFKEDTLSTRYFIFGCVLPFVYLIYILFKAKTPSDYHQASSFIKYIMIVGALYSVVLYFILARIYQFPIFDLFVLTK